MKRYISVDRKNEYRNQKHHKIISIIGYKPANDKCENHIMSNTVHSVLSNYNENMSKLYEYGFRVFNVIWDRQINHATE